MTAGWTKGSWRWDYDDDGFYVVLAEEMPSPFIVATGGEGDDDKANVVLIAAAPDLYEALVAANSVLTAAADELKLHQNGVLLTIRAALTKATTP